MSNWIKFKGHKSPYTYNHIVSVKLFNGDIMSDIMSNNINWDNRIRTNDGRITHYYRHYSFEIGDTVIVSNPSLATYESIGLVINITPDDLIHVKLSENYVIHRDGRPASIVVYKECNLELLSKQSKDPIVSDKVPAIAILYGSKENNFDTAQVEEYMQCEDVEDAKQESAKMIKQYKDSDLQYFWLTITNLPQQVDIEETLPKLVKI